MMQKDIGTSKGGTQFRLLEAAMDIFGRDGYQAATTRAIAGKANVNIAAIPYYYNGKEGLYQAVITHIVDLIKQQITGPVQEISGLSFAGEDGKVKALNKLETVLETLINFMLGSSQGTRIARIILREQMYPTSAYDSIFNGFMAPLLDALAVLIIALTGNPSGRTARMRALAIMGQVMAFRVARETIVRSLDLEGYSASELDEIRSIIFEHTRNILHSPI
jgi:TetR/AcrR family transcriptional regulator, regulator of cefoperazone and chloramphenicol sensitivity